MSVRFIVVEKRKRDPVVPEMRERLLANRDGRLMPSQWLDLIVQPLLILALLIGVAFVVFGELMLALLADSWWVVRAVVGCCCFFGPVILRAYRYARAPDPFRAALRRGSALVRVGASRRSSTPKATSR